MVSPISYPEARTIQFIPKPFLKIERIKMPIMTSGLEIGRTFGSSSLENPPFNLEEYLFKIREPNFVPSVMIPISVSFKSKYCILK